jgi:hypothetical protein
VRDRDVHAMVVDGGLIKSGCFCLNKGWLVQSPRLDCFSLEVHCSVPLSSDDDATRPCGCSWRGDTWCGVVSLVHLSWSFGGSKRQVYGRAPKEIMDRQLQFRDPYVLIVVLPSTHNTLH